MSMKNCNDTIGNRTRGLPAYSACLNLLRNRVPHWQCINKIIFSIDLASFELELNTFRSLFNWARSDVLPHSVFVLRPLLSYGTFQYLPTLCLMIYSQNTVKFLLIEYSPSCGSSTLLGPNIFLSTVERQFSECQSSEPSIFRMSIVRTVNFPNVNRLNRQLSECQSSEPSIIRTTAVKKTVTMYFPVTGYYTEKS